MEKIYYTDNEYVEFDEKARKIYATEGRTFGNKGTKSKALSKEEYDKYLDLADGDEIEAILIFLEDEGIAANEEQEALDAVKVKVGNAKSEGAEKKKRKPREKKVDPVKHAIIESLAAAYDADETIIVDDQKIILFIVDGEEYKVNLTKTNMNLRDKKEGAK